MEYIRHINHNSDFKDFVTIDPSLDGCKFRFVYSVGRSRYIAEYDGQRYRNCVRKDNTLIVVVFDNHGLPEGRVSVERTFWIPDETFPDGNEKVVTREMLDVVLTDGKTDKDDSEISSSVILEAMRGYRGYSAYEIAVQNGFEGTEEQWLASFNYVLTENDKQEIAGIVKQESQITEYVEGSNQYNDF